MQTFLIPRTPFTFALMNRKELSAEEFTYPLPDERIAKYPLANRNQSKLLVYQGGTIKVDVFAQLQDHLPEESVLVFNNTKVLAARLHFQKVTGAKIEIFCLEPHQQTVEQALSATQSCQWQCMVGNLKRFKPKDTLELQIAGTVLRANLLERREQDVIIQFSWEGGIDFAQILAEAGEIPLPPYLNRATESSDEESYQTVYAKQEGAVAAPTAGLHFVNEQLEALQQKGHELSYLTLYVGAGTFRAVKTDKLVDHEMHSERIVISKSTIAQLAGKKGKIITVGTTSLRSLESLYWLANKINESGNTDECFVSQEDAYQLSPIWSWSEACQFLLSILEETGKTAFDFHSSLFIMPGYQWQAIDGLITNFISRGVLYCP